MIQLNESSTLEFSVNIQNTTGKLDKASLVIECGGYDISFPINLIEDKAIVDLPILENIVPPGKNNIRMEMVIGNTLYVPFRDSIDFCSPPSIKVESVKSTPDAVIGPVIVVVENKKSITEVTIEKKVESPPKSIYHTQFSALMEQAFNEMGNK
jgi:hypothetical protein